MTNNSDAHAHTHTDFNQYAELQPLHSLIRASLSLSRPRSLSLALSLSLSAASGCDASFVFATGFEVPREIEGEK